MCVAICVYMCWSHLVYDNLWLWLCYLIFLTIITFPGNEQTNNLAGTQVIVKFVEHMLQSGEGLPQT